MYVHLALSIHPFTNQVKVTLTLFRRDGKQILVKLLLTRFDNEMIIFTVTVSNDCRQSLCLDAYKV